jgi:putative acetyltransferase
MKSEEIKLVRTTSENSDFSDLIKLLDHELFENYGEQQVTYNQHNQVGKLDTVLLIYYHNEAIGCGCFRQFNDEGTVEIKRMYVKKLYRGKGISKIILKELEKWAVEEGYRLSVLETGVLQHEAIGLYLKQGYEKTKCYGDYAHLNNSICFIKRLY